MWLAYTPEAFVLDLTPHLPACCAHLAQYLQFNGSFFLTAVYSLYYLMLEPFAGLTWTGRWAGAEQGNGMCVVHVCCLRAVRHICSIPELPTSRMLDPSSPQA